MRWRVTHGVRASNNSRQTPKSNHQSVKYRANPVIFITSIWIDKLAADYATRTRINTRYFTTLPSEPPYWDYGAPQFGKRVAPFHCLFTYISACTSLFYFYRFDNGSDSDLQVSIQKHFIWIGDKFVYLSYLRY